jgi:eukaryotic-like serine/threonine-protein kinase
MPLAAGTRLDSFEIVAPLGAGGMGEVYRARDPILKREVAIKVLPAYVSQDPERLRRFEQEAQAAAALNHPNILAVHRFGTFEGAPYMVSELLEGGTLGRQLSHGPLPVRKAIDYGVQIASGLAAAHEKGIVHRDLKPDNIFVTKDGRVKILDFGLAKLTEAKSADGPTVTRQEGTEPGMVLGTVGYMSPEQVRGETADHRADIFAFGAILYEMLTGKRAFRKPTSTETMTAILNEDPTGISQIAPGTPPALLRIVHRCLEKNPEQRFQSASDLAFGLEALSESGSTSVAAVAEGSRSRWTWALAAGAVVALAAALIAWWRIPPAVPIVESVTQLTEDGEPKKGALVSDGARIYFNEGQSKSWRIAQVSVSGGPTAPVDTRLASPQLTAVAPDGSALLVLLGGMDAATGPLWSIPLPAGEPRRLGNIEGQWASYFPDGRIVFSAPTELYVADKDGSNPRKLFATPAASTPSPIVSPDGERIEFNVSPGNDPDQYSLAQITAKGTDFRTLLQDACCAAWASDGKYLVYRVPSAGGQDLWALPMQTGILHRTREPVRLTNGPLTYSGATVSHDGKQIFAIGTKRRGELVRYDMASHQLVPFLSGISAIQPDFSRDGQWVVYVSYPDYTLWRSRIDGSERTQLTYPPMKVTNPSISPDGKKVAFSTYGFETYIVAIDGGPPQKIIGKFSNGTSWSPDGNIVLATSYVESIYTGRANNAYMQIFDVRTGKLSVLPSSEGKGGGEWISQDSLVAVNNSVTKLLTYDFNTGKWSDLVEGIFVSWMVSPDRKYLYIATGGAEPKAQRLRLADHQIETITSLKNFRRVADSAGASIAPDGSPVFTRDIGSQEIYALTVKWP